jgi:hypothetical protein
MGAVIHDCDQRSPEWFALRRSRLTASQAGAWLTKSDKRSIDAERKAVNKCLAEFLGQELQPVFENWAMERGTSLEAEAVESLENDMELSVSHVGFMSSKEYRAGCSPDGIISGTGIGFEGKCPVPDTHIGYILDNNLLREAYCWQVEFSMAVTGAKAWWLQSYCPELPPVRVFFEPSETTDAIKAGLARFTERFTKSAVEVCELAGIKIPDGFDWAADGALIEPPPPITIDWEEL